MIASSVTIQPTLVLKLSKQTCANNLIRKTIKFSLPPHASFHQLEHIETNRCRAYTFPRVGGEGIALPRVSLTKTTRTSLSILSPFISRRPLSSISRFLYTDFFYTLISFISSDRKNSWIGLAKDGPFLSKSLEESSSSATMGRKYPRISPSLPGMKNTRLDGVKKMDDAQEAKLEGCAAFQAGLVGEEEEEGESNFRRQLIGHSRSVILNRLIEFLPIFFLSAPFIDASRRPTFSFHAPSTFSFPSHRSPLSSVSDLSHVPLRDQFVNRICELVVSHPPSFLSPRILHSSSRRAEEGGCLATPFDLSSIR